MPEVRPEPLLNAYPTIEKKLDGYYLKPSLEVDAYVSRGNSEIVGESSNYYGVLMVLGAGDEQTQGRRTALVHNYLVLSDGYASLYDATLISQSTSGQHRLLTLPGSAQHVSRVNQFLSVYALEGEQANGTVSDSMRLVHSVGQGQNTSSDNGAKGEYVLDTGRIAAMRVLSHEETGTVQVDDVFYLKADGSDSRQYRLYGARVEHFNNKVYSPIDSAVIPVDKFLSQVTLTDFDVDIPAAAFQIQTIAGTTYLYWMETVIPENSGDPTHYLIRAVAYDAEKNMVSAILSLADITPEKATDVPVSVYLSEGGVGYYITDSDANGSDAVEGTVYSFPLQLVTGLDIESADMEYSMVTAGSYSEMLLTLRNNGNVSISGFDIDVFEQDSKGNRSKVQSLHVDCLNEKNNRNTVVGSDSGSTGIPAYDSHTQGASGIYRINGFSDGNNGDTWYLKRSVTRYASSSTNSGGESWAQTGLLMPGASACYKASLRVAPEWEGDYLIQLQVAKLYTVSNWTSVVSVEGGQGASRASEEVPLIYEVALMEDGSVQITPPASARNSAVPYSLSNDITFDSETVDTSAEDLELDYRVFTRGGERMLEMTILNRAAADGRSSRTGGVTLRAWADGDEEAETFRYVFPQEIVDGRTHTITLPVAWLAGAADPAEVTVEISGKDYQEAEVADNRFVIRLREEPLVFVRQPADMTVIMGETAQFQVEASGGAFPYAYRWQMRTGETGAWTDVAGTQEAVLSLTATHDMDGLQVRCIVTDGNFDQIVSAAVTLRVTQLPLTGDQSMPGLWALMAVLSLVLAALSLRLRNLRRTNET